MLPSLRRPWLVWFDIVDSVFKILMDGVEKAAAGCMCIDSMRIPSEQKDVGERTKRRNDKQVYTNIRKKDLVRGSNIGGPIIQSTNVRLGPKTRGMESNDVSEPASCYAEIQIYRRGHYIRRNCVCFLSKLQPKRSNFRNWNKIRKNFHSLNIAFREKSLPMQLKPRDQYYRIRRWSRMGWSRLYYRHMRWSCKDVNRTSYTLEYRIHRDGTNSKSHHVRVDQDCFDRY